MRMFRFIRCATKAGLVGLLLASSTGCMFKVRHEIPLNAYVNPEPGGTRRTGFEGESMKNWALAGLVPYSDFGTKNLVERRRGREISSLSIETVFTGIDTLIWVVPGFAYGYYLWAPRHVRVHGEYVDGAAPPVLPIPLPR